MAADELSPINMPAVAWTANADSRGPGGESKESDKKLQRPRKKKTKSPPEVEFEQVEHELDSIA
ncbi:MAG TPA: hypothetical protein VFA90_21095 [Terriglobales bacterium]|nr:hypothetical protein [Terriglobales bacterium]